ncbi:MAG: GerAB/ArcD/ProY family transporter [Firmicutes bacterium]|nr:GerAB/ArcD/ProY family transporter [Bacillota bacterium]
MLFTCGTIGIFGHDYLGRFTYPGLDAIHVVEFPYLLLEQAGLLMIIAWLALVVVGSSFYYYALGLGLAQVTGVLDYKRFVWLLFPLTLYLAICPQNINEAQQFMQFIDDYGWLVLFGLPVLLYLLALVFKQRSARLED